MERGVCDLAGGTVSLIELCAEHGESLEFDLIGLGLRLRDCPSPAFNWRDLWVIVRHLGRDSATWRAANPDEDTSWTVTDYLLAVIADNTGFRLWQAAGGKGQRPKPIPRPGDVKKYKGDAMPVDELRDWLGWDDDYIDDPRVARDARVRAALGKGEPRKAIAAREGVSVSTIGRIARTT